MNNPIVLVRYTDFVRTYLWAVGPTRAAAVPVNLTGYSALFEIRQQPTDSSPLISISTTPNAQGQITLGGAAGTIAVWIFKDAVTQLPPEPWPELGYGLNVITPDGLTLPFISGDVVVKAGFVHG